MRQNLHVFSSGLVFIVFLPFGLFPFILNAYPITASRDFCDYSVFLVRGSGEEVVFIWEGGLNRGFTVNHIPLNCYWSGPKDFHLFEPTFELVPRLKTSRNSFSLSLVLRKSPENKTAFAHSCLPLGTYKSAMSRG